MSCAAEDDATTFKVEFTLSLIYLKYSWNLNTAFSPDSSFSTPSYFCRFASTCLIGRREVYEIGAVGV